MIPEAFIDELMVGAATSLREALAAAYRRGREDERNTSIAFIREPVPGKPLPEDVLRAVERITGVRDFAKHPDMPPHCRRYADLRFAAAVLLRDYCGLSYPAIAEVLGYTDHTSVMHGVRSWLKRPGVVALVRQCREMLTPSEAVA